MSRKNTIILTVTVTLMIGLITAFICSVSQEKIERERITNGDPKVGYVCLDRFCNVTQVCEEDALITKQRYRFVRSIRHEQTIDSTRSSSICKD